MGIKVIRAKLFSQFIRYFSAAGIGYIFDFATLILLHEVLQVHYLIAASIGFTVGLIVVYAISSKYVFGQSRLKSRSSEFLLFTVIGIVGLALLNTLMWGLTDILNINYLLSKIVATVFVYTWNFFARRSLYIN